MRTRPWRFYRYTSLALLPLLVTVWKCSPHRWSVLSPWRRSCWFPVWGLRRPTRTACSPRCTLSARTPEKRSVLPGSASACRRTATTAGPPPLRVWCWRIKTTTQLYTSFFWFNHILWFFYTGSTLYWTLSERVYWNLWDPVGHKPFLMNVRIRKAPRRMFNSTLLILTLACIPPPMGQSICSTTDAALKSQKNDLASNYDPIDYQLHHCQLTISSR